MPTSVRLINNNNFSFDKKADVMSHALGWDEIIIITMIIIIIVYNMAASSTDAFWQARQKCYS